MSISKTRLIYNLSVIVLSAIVAMIFYPSTASGLLIGVAAIGTFMTLDRVAPISKKNILYVGVPVAVLFFMIVILTMHY